MILIRMVRFRQLFLDLVLMALHADFWSTNIEDHAAGVDASCFVEQRGEAIDFDCRWHFGGA